MKRVKTGDPETQSVDVVAENIERLKDLFPEAFAEGKVDFDVLRQLLGDCLDEGEEKYGLNWHGKRHARQLALTPSTGTLRPCPEESVDWGTTRNLMIEGDNPRGAEVTSEELCRQGQADIHRPSVQHRAGFRLFG